MGLGFLAVLMFGRIAFAQPVVPSEFYIVAEGVSDEAYPDGSLPPAREILDVRPEGEGSHIVYIRISPVGLLCGKTISVMAREAHLSGISPSRLLSPGGFCAVTQRAIDRALKGNLPEGRFGIVAKCQGEERILSIGNPDSRTMSTLHRRAPGILSLAELESVVLRAAFSDLEPFKSVSTAEAWNARRAGDSWVPELRSGKYDRGLAPRCLRTGNSCVPGTFAEVLKDYAGPAPDAPALLSPGRGRFEVYDDPFFPPLARAMRIQGHVTLRLQLDASSGDVKSAAVVLGHPVFTPSALEAAKKWRVNQSPGQPMPETLDVVIDYSLRCP